MPNVSVFDMNGKKVSDLALAESVFGIEPNSYAMHLCVVNYLANQRQGTQSTRTRSEVSGGGKKPWKQKGTGRARQGSYLLAIRACDLINIKLMKAGGLGPASQIASMAQASGIDCMMGCMLESKIGITAAASLSAGNPAIAINDLDAADLMADDPIIGGISYDRNELILPQAPGLGITDVAGWQEWDYR